MFVDLQLPSVSLNLHGAWGFVPGLGGAAVYMRRVGSKVGTFEALFQSLYNTIDHTACLLEHE